MGRRFGGYRVGEGRGEDASAVAVVTQELDLLCVLPKFSEFSMVLIATPCRYLNVLSAIPYYGGQQVMRQSLFGHRGPWCVWIIGNVRMLRGTHAHAACDVGCLSIMHEGFSTGTIFLRYH